MKTTDILRRPPFKLSEQESEQFINLAKKFDIVLDDFLLGRVFSKTSYTEAQQSMIAQDLQRIFERTFTGKTPSTNKKYTATAGAPGVGKSAFIEQLVEDDPGLRNTAYVDPDRQALRFMEWYQQLSKEQGGQVAYETCRDASNYICNFLMVWAIYKGYSIVHGTTATNDRIAKSIFPQLKAQGYTIDMHVLFADALSRKRSLLHRIQVQDFYQVTQADAKGKVAPVFDRLTDAYLKYADSVSLYYNIGEFWLCKNRLESTKHLKKFATFSRAQDPKHVKIEPNCEDILPRVISEIKTEVSQQQKQEAIIEMFQSWFQRPSKNYLPSFNRYTALAATLAVATVGAAVYFGIKDNSSNKPSHKPNF